MNKKAVTKAIKKEKKKGKFEPGTFDLRVKRSRAGLGLFTFDPIKKGECIIEYTGPRLSKKQEEETENQYLFDVGKKYPTIDGSPRSNTARYINHSCRPNCEIEIRLGRVYVFSKRNIKAGEELNYDYDTDFFDEYIKPKGCVCDKCREKAGKK
ncbi:MAG TPA: SET domain-containing protein [Candidatus Paceibacterota bacterium]